MTETIERLYKIREVSDHYGVKDRTVRRWVHEGKIAYVRNPGGGLRFPESVFSVAGPTGRNESDE